MIDPSLSAQSCTVKKCAVSFETCTRLRKTGVRSLENALIERLDCAHRCQLRTDCALAGARAAQSSLSSQGICASSAQPFSRLIETYLEYPTMKFIEDDCGFDDEAELRRHITKLRGEAQAERAEREQAQQAAE